MRIKEHYSDGSEFHTNLAQLLFQELVLIHSLKLLKWQSFS